MANTGKDLAKTGNDLIKTMDDFFQKAPSLPAGGREVLVKVAPWVALVFGILGVIVGIGAVGLSPLALFAGFNASVTVLISGVLSLVSSVLMLMAFPKLQKRHMGGWTLLFWSEVVSVVSSLLMANIFGALIGGLVGFYLLFQIRSYYK